DALLLHVPQSALLAILDATPQYWRQFALLMAQKLRLSFLTVESMSVMSAAQRLAARLLMIADGYGGISAGRTRVRLSQEKLAAMLSLTRQTTNQLLNALQADGVVRLHVGEIEIVDVDALRR
ncbi:Crp/Fnr family transcriptional regulator, partial [Burkholderia multivorans]